MRNFEDNIVKEITRMVLKQQKRVDNINNQKRKRIIINSFIKKNIINN